MEPGLDYYQRQLMEVAALLAELPATASEKLVRYLAQQVALASSQLAHKLDREAGRA